MRRLDKEIEDENVIKEILTKSRICRFGFVDNDEAYIVPLNFAYSDGCIYVHSAHHGRKMDLINQNNRVSFEIEYYTEIIEDEKACNWTLKYRSAMGRGVITIENDRTSKINGLNLIMQKYGAKGDLKYDEDSLSKMTLLKLEIESVTGKQSGDW
ncbi:MAG: pyridoxamine 5'-phosphate oxidase family protein [Paludibacter sp.]|nr:pyridoxamine 5'-phosphate oxidase family protein [Paludibacter sp.]